MTQDTRAGLDTHEEWEPDCFDLNDWLLLCYPAAFTAVRYASPEVAYRVTREFWIQQGKPDIEADLARVSPAQQGSAKGGAK